MVMAEDGIECLCTPSEVCNGGGGQRRLCSALHTLFISIAGLTLQLAV